MNITNLLKNEIFLKKDQFEKRKILKKYILKDKDCIIGNELICFENEIVVKNKFNYEQYVKGHKISTVTIGKSYRILDYKNGKVKLQGDNGKKSYYTINRFIYCLALERKEKLEKLKKIYNE